MIFKTLARPGKSLDSNDWLCLCQWPLKSALSGFPIWDRNSSKEMKIFHKSGLGKRLVYVRRNETKVYPQTISIIVKFPISILTALCFYNQNQVFNKNILSFSGELKAFQVTTLPNILSEYFNTFLAAELRRKSFPYRSWEMCAASLKEEFVEFRSIRPGRVIYRCRNVSKCFSD